MEVESHQFSNTDYVLIRVYIGKMPPNRAKDYIARLRESTALCKQLDERNISYDMVGVRDNTDGMSVKKTKKTVSSDRQKELDKFHKDFIAKLASAASKIKKDAQQPLPTTVTAERNDILKTDLTDDLKKDSFADAMSFITK